MAYALLGVLNMNTQINTTANQNETWVGLMAVKQIVPLLSMSRANFFKKVKSGTFPPPVIRMERYTRWKASDVQAWINDPTRWIKANSEK